AETFALMRQARVVLDDEHGSHLSDDEFVAALSHAVLDGAPTIETTGRAKFQIAVTCVNAAGRAGRTGPARRSRSAPPRSSAPSAMLSTSDRSMAARQRAHTRTLRQVSHAWSGVATVGAAACLGVAPHAGSRPITWFTAPRAVVMTP